MRITSTTLEGINKLHKEYHIAHGSKEKEWPAIQEFNGLYKSK